MCYLYPVTLGRIKPELHLHNFNLIGFSKHQISKETFKHVGNSSNYNTWYVSVGQNLVLCLLLCFIDQCFSQKI